MKAAKVARREVAAADSDPGAREGADVIVDLLSSRAPSRCVTAVAPTVATATPRTLEVPIFSVNVSTEIA
ncbi:hypothetical protein GCM10009625_18690 [Brachybacterium fresconis]